MDRSTNTLLQRLLAPFAEGAYSLLRILAGAMLTFHGVQKIFGVLTDHQPAFGTQLWIGGALELVCGSAIALGLFTRLAALLASGMLAVAYVQFHWQLRFDSAFFPVINRGELAALYSLVFFYVACKGAGPLSIDGRRGKRSD